MVQLQILSQVLHTQDISIIENNQLTVDYFTQYEDEYKFIAEHYKEWGNIPDKATFLSTFSDFELVEVTESEDYLVNTIREEYLYYKSVPVVQNIAKLLKTDANAAAEYMLQAVKELKPNYKTAGVDIIKDSIQRFEAFIDRRDNQDNWFFTTGLQELDDIIHGLNRAEELFVIFARTNQGKSWIAEKICTHIWEIGFNVGYVSPEMSALSVGYRFDTLHKNFSNQSLMYGKKDFDDSTYNKYLNELRDRHNKFMVATPSDFGNRMTVSSMRQFIVEHKLDLLCIDGLTYMSDERGKRNDNKSTSLTNICEDLKKLGMELNIPIIIVVQANRNGVVDKDSDDLPELEHMRDSDGISHNATIVIALKQTRVDDSDELMITLQIKKGRNNRVGDKLSYNWKPDIGEFISANVNTITTHREERRSQRKKAERKEDLF